MLLIRLAETVIAHRRRPLDAALVDVLAMEQLQRHPDPGELTMHRRPVRLRMHALMLPTAREQQLIHRRLVQVGDIVPAHTLPVCGLDDPSSRSRSTSFALILRTIPITPSAA